MRVVDSAPSSSTSRRSAASSTRETSSRERCCCGRRRVGRDVVGFRRERFSYSRYGFKTVLEREREQVAEAARRLAAAGLVHGTSGNVSARAGEHVAMTPTGAALAELDASDVAVVDLDGRVVDGALAPTSEAGLHPG